MGSYKSYSGLLYEIQLRNIMGVLTLNLGSSTNTAMEYGTDLHGKSHIHDLDFFFILS